MLVEIWSDIPLGAQIALKEQWAGLAARGLPCGSSIVDEQGAVVAFGRNCVYDSGISTESESRYLLRENRLAHAELNALAQLPANIENSTLTLWATQHPCKMCAAAIEFFEIGKVNFLAFDLSISSPLEVLLSNRGAVAYELVPLPIFSTISSLLFLYTPAVLFGDNANNIKMNMDWHPSLVSLVLGLAKEDILGKAARSGKFLLETLDNYFDEIKTVSEFFQSESQSRLTKLGADVGRSLSN